MVAILYYVVLFAAFGFWLDQVFDLLFRDLRFFESHTHKLTWFLVLIVGNIVGALWYYVWKKAAVPTQSVPGQR